MAMLQLRGLNLDKRRTRDDKELTWKFFRELGLIDGNYLAERNYSGIDGAWQNEPAYVIGSAPSLRDTLPAVGGWEFFRGKHTIGINHLVEDWDGFEWLFFLDKRFLATTTYDLKQFRGMIFAQCNTGMKPAENVKVFYCRRDRVSSKISEGLHGSLSGVAAVNLALISGANPIYLFGMDQGRDELDLTCTHFRAGYTGEKFNPKLKEKYSRIMLQYDAYRVQHADRLFLVTNGGKQIPWMRRAKASGLAPHARPRVTVEPREAKVVHLSFSADINRHADITRNNVTMGVGKRSIIDVRSQPIPEADVYVVEHFLSTNSVVNAMMPEQKARSVNIVHTAGCLPQGRWGRVIALTEAWKRHLTAHQVKVDRVIVPGVDLAAFAKVTPDYTAQVFGRITRWNAEKVHPEWARVEREVLETVPQARALYYVSKADESARPFTKDKRITYSTECKIHQFKGDFLKKLSVYVHVNGSFKETLSFAVIEAMATGLPVVYLTEGTGVIEEVVAGCGVRCETLDQARDVLVAMLKDEEYRKEYGAMARENAKRFDHLRAVKQFDEEVLLCLKSPR